jgi:hypothetical protein
MQAPHPHQKKTAQKHKVWAKKLSKKLGNQWIFWRAVGKFWQPVK